MAEQRDPYTSGDEPPGSIGHPYGQPGKPPMRPGMPGMPGVPVMPKRQPKSTPRPGGRKR